MSELETLFDAIQVAVAIQDLTHGQIMINGEAKELLSAAHFPLPDFRKTISSMHNRQNQIETEEKFLSVDCSIVPLRDRTIKLCILRDISEQTEIEEREQIYKACLESITDMNLFACDTKGTILLYNNTSAESDNMGKENIVGLNMYDIFGRDSDTAIRRALATGEAALNYKSEYDVSGRHIVNIGSAYPIKTDGKLIGAFSINRSYNGIRKLLARTLELQRLLNEPRKDDKNNGTSYDLDNILGESDGILKAKHMAKKAAGSSSNILIYGETGTGKELFAQGIHNAGVTREHPFVAINCAAIPETLLESTLFGTVKGAFTGSENMKGLFEQAGEGTLFLDEVNSLPLNMQAKLLRVLQERAYMRVGGTKQLNVNCRILSACNLPPDECVSTGILRQDLYYRLAAISIEIPPLRERTDDIIPLAKYFLNRYSSVYGMNRIEISDELASSLKNYSWPGNVRELQHIIESALLQLSPGEKLSLYHLPDSLARKIASSSIPLKTDCPLNEEPYDLEEMLRDERKRAILRAIKITDGNISKAAKLIGYNRSTLQYQMEKLGIKIKPSKKGEKNES